MVLYSLESIMYKHEQYLGPYEECAHPLDRVVIVGGKNGMILCQVT